MKFLELNIGDYFVLWSKLDECYYLYYKNSEYGARWVDNDLKDDWKPDDGFINFHSDTVVHKVVI